MNLKKRAISSQQGTPVKPAELQKKVVNSKKIQPTAIKKERELIHMGSIGASLIIIGLLIIGIIQLIKSLDFSSLVFSFGKPPVTTVEGKVNILLVGVGGKGHDGQNLTDTLMIASIDMGKNTVALISIPRDLYVKTSETGASKINAVFPLALKSTPNDENAALMTVAKTVTSITNIPINYYIKIDFGGFVTLVDALGGIQVDVPYTLYDPEYPKDGTYGYEPFSLKKGLQDLDGTTALKYARSRKGNSGNDKGRTERQQQLLYALKEKALNLNILTNPAKIQELYSSVSQSITTNLSIPEIIELAKRSKDIPKTNVSSIVFNDDVSSCGGFLYAAGIPEFIFLPVGKNYNYIHFFNEITIKNIEIINEQKPVYIFNGTKTGGLASEARYLLKRFCFNAVDQANAPERGLEKTTIYYEVKPTDKEKTIPPIVLLIQKIIPGTIMAGIPSYVLEDPKYGDASIVVELGKDYITNKTKGPFDSVPVYTPPKPQPAPVSESTL